MKITRINEVYQFVVKIKTFHFQNYFGIHPHNGSIFINAPLDREVAKTIVLTVEVTDINAYFPNPQRALGKLSVVIVYIVMYHTRGTK